MTMRDRRFCPLMMIGALLAAALVFLGMVQTADAIAKGKRYCPYPIRLRVPVVENKGSTSLLMVFEDCTQEAVEKTCARHFSDEKMKQEAAALVSTYINALKEYQLTAQSSPALDFLRAEVAGQETHIPIHENCNAIWGSLLEAFMFRPPLKGVLDVGAVNYIREQVVESCERSRYCNDGPPNRSPAWHEHMQKLKDMYFVFSEDLRAVKERASTYCNEIFRRKANFTYDECRPNNNQDLFRKLCIIRDDEDNTRTKEGQQTHYCQLSDVEAEMTYLRIRAFKPRRVFELSPFHGFSTFWILSALRDNGFGTLHSYDITDNVVKHGNIPNDLVFLDKSRSERRWFFTQGDARDILGGLSDKEVQFDYLFIDSLHTADFAKMYLRDVFSRQTSKLRGSIHDCFMHRCGRTREECTEVLRWFGEHGHDVDDEIFSASLRGNFDFYAPIMKASHESAKPLNRNYQYPSITELSEQVVDALNELKAGPLIFVGVGAGSRVLMEAAIKAPHHARALVLVSPTYNAAGLLERVVSRVIDACPDWLRKQGILTRLILARHFSSTFRGKKSSVVAAVESVVRSVSPTTIRSYWATFTSRRELDLFDLSVLSDMHVMLVVGTRASFDCFGPSYHAEFLELRRNFPAKTTVSIRAEHTGSLVTEEDPPYLAGHIRRFLSAFS
eukprot:g2354.t1